MLLKYLAKNRGRGKDKSKAKCKENDGNKVEAETQGGVGQKVRRRRLQRASGWIVECALLVQGLQSCVVDLMRDTAP